MNDRASGIGKWLSRYEGRLIAGRELADLTWLRVGGPAEWFLRPRDREDLARFLAGPGRDADILVLGVGSNLIVRDGGIPGVVIRLGREFGAISIDGERVRAGAAALDSRVALKAADAGLDLTFLRTIPGTVGGAVRMNSGCYGRYMADICHEVTVMTGEGQIRTLQNREIGFGYRTSNLPAGCIILEAVLSGPRDCPDSLSGKMAEQISHRNDTQPTRIMTAGSTFRNPSGRSSTGPGDVDHDMKAWKLIDAAGMRGARNGNACVSPKHPNFLVNLGGATATEIEQLGDAVRARVLENSGIELEWELLRLGVESPETTGAGRG